MVKWELVSFINRSQQRRKILLALRKPATPSKLSKETGMYLTHVSRALRELTEKGLVDCLTPKERVEKYYRISNLGRAVLNKIINMKEE